MDEDFNLKLAKLQQLSATCRNVEVSAEGGRVPERALKKQLNFKLKNGIDKNKLKSYTSSIPTRAGSKGKKNASQCHISSTNRSGSRNWIKKRGIGTNIIAGASSHRSKKSNLIKASTVECVKDQLTNYSSQRKMKSKNSKRSISRDINKSKIDSKKQGSKKPSLFDYYSSLVLFKNVVYDKWWKREKIGNRIVIGPKIGINPVGISGELVKALKELINQCDNTSIPEMYPLKGVYKSGWLLFYDFAQETSESKANLMITNPNKDDLTGILQKNMFFNAGSIMVMPELRMECINSPQRNKEYYQTKVNMFCVYPNWSFEIYPIKTISLIDKPLSRKLTQWVEVSDILDFQYGYLSLDTKGRMITFSHNDSDADKYPLVGIWVHGLSANEDDLNDRHLTRNEKEDIKTASLRHYKLWQWLIGFLLKKNSLPTRSASKSKNTFLLLNFLKVGVAINPQLYEFKLCGWIDANDNKWVVSKYTNSSHCSLTSNKNLTYKFSSSDTHSFEKFYSMCKPSGRTTIYEKSQRKSTRRKNKSRNQSKDDKSIRNNKTT